LLRHPTAQAGKKGPTTALTEQHSVADFYDFESALTE
jgi:hypothetical protein